MWYFAWMLGLPLAVAFAVLNAMWFELVEDAAQGASSRSGGETARTHPGPRSPERRG